MIHVSNSLTCEIIYYLACFAKHDKEKKSHDYWVRFLGKLIDF